MTTTNQRGTLCDLCGIYTRGWWHTPEGEDLCEPCMTASPRPLDLPDPSIGRLSWWARWRERRAEKRELLPRYRESLMGPGIHLLPAVKYPPPHLPACAAVHVHGPECGHPTP